MGLIRDWRRRRRLVRGLVPEAEWHAVCADLPLLTGLGADEGRRLHELATLFLHEKAINGARGFEPTARQRLTVAALCCLPVLGLGLDWLDGWVEVILYPATFIAEGQTVDRAGVVHRYREERAGEAWERGPLVLAWSDLDAAREPDGYNPAIHEIAHKLDALNGAMDGLPPLHRGQSLRRWAEVFGQAYEEMGAILAAGAEPLIDPYAAESPAEFFAVVSESFFETPRFLDAYYPELFEQLAAFYRQDPRGRLEF